MRGRGGERGREAGIGREGGRERERSVAILAQGLTAPRRQALGVLGAPGQSGGAGAPLGPLGRPGPAAAAAVGPAIRRELRGEAPAVRRQGRVAVRTGRLPGLHCPPAGLHVRGAHLACRSFELRCRLQQRRWLLARPCSLRQQPNGQWAGRGRGARAPALAAARHGAPRGAGTGPRRWRRNLSACRPACNCLRGTRRC